MSMRVTTPQSEISGFLERRMQMIEMILVRGLCIAGERCVNKARKSHDYTDQTGNLTSSMGYAVSVDGNLVQVSSFTKVKDGAEGAKGGQEYVRQLIGNYPTGIALVVVAGMEYAEYVSDRGYDVLDSAESLAEKIIPQLLKKLGIK